MSRPVAGMGDCMTNHERTRRSTQAGLASDVLAAALPVGVAVRPWSWPAEGPGWQVLVAGAAVALIMVLQFLWLYRARSAGRRQAALDAYAAREIVREGRRRALPLTSDSRPPQIQQTQPE